MPDFSPPKIRDVFYMTGDKNFSLRRVAIKENSRLRLFQVQVVPIMAKQQSLRFLVGCDLPENKIHMGASEKLASASVVIKQNWTPMAGKGPGSECARFRRQLARDTHKNLICDYFRIS